jgi:hypothetical protein
MSRRIAMDRLLAAIHGVHALGESVACVDRLRSDLWISEDRASQAAAVRGCLSCPALTSCRTYIDVYPETSGVWAGQVMQESEEVGEPAPTTR